MSRSFAGQIEEKPRRPSLPAIFVAPILGIARVSRAASLLTRASAVQLGLLMLFYIALEASLCVGMAVWDASIQYDFRTASGVSGGSWEIQSLTMAQVWSSWAARGNRNPAIPIFMGTAFATQAAVIVAIALFWPRVHRHGRLRPALRRTLAAVLASCGLAILLTAIVFSGFVLIRHWNLWHGIRWGRGVQEEHIAIVGTLSSILLMLYTLSRAVRAASDANYAPDPPPQCEGCGYDLTHRPASGVCPECGASVDRSLEQGMGRRPADFDKATSLPDAMSTSLEALFSPVTFYRRVTVRIEPQRDSLFRLRHHTAIFIGALIWMTILVLSTARHSWGFDECVGILAGAMGATIAGWALQQAIGGIVCLVWAVKRTLPDLRWGIRVLNFETVYLWLFCLFNGMMITSFVMFKDWIGDLLGTFNQATGLPTAFLAIAIPNLTMIGYWIVRLLRGGRAVQWANF